MINYLTCLDFLIVTLTTPPIGLSPRRDIAFLFFFSNLFCLDRPLLAGEPSVRSPSMPSATEAAAAAASSSASRSVTLGSLVCFSELLMATEGKQLNGGWSLGAGREQETWRTVTCSFSHNVLSSQSWNVCIL